MAFTPDTEESYEVDFSGMDAAAIKSLIVDYVKQIRRLETDKKEFTGASNDAIKEIKSRLNSALFELSGKEA